jgi:hypothetical protein
LNNPDYKAGRLFETAAFAVSPSFELAHKHKTPRSETRRGNGTRGGDPTQEGTHKHAFRSFKINNYSGEFLSFLATGYWISCLHQALRLQAPCPERRHLPRPAELTGLVTVQAPRSPQQQYGNGQPAQWARNT